MNGDDSPITRREFNQKWADHASEMERERQSGDRAVQLAKLTVDKELAHLNKLREDYNARVQSLPSREELDALSARINGFEKWQSNLTGRFWALGVALVILGALIGYTISLMRTTPAIH